MRYIFIFFVSLFLSNYLYSQAVVKIEKPSREIRFVDLSKPENAPFWRMNRWLPKLVMDGIYKGQVTPYFIDYDKNAGEIRLNITEWEKRLRYSSEDIYKESDGMFTDLLSPRDFYIIGLDATVGVYALKEYSQVNYINFYFREIGSQGPIQYRFSIKWEDLIRILSEHDKILYYTNSHRSWWRGNIFLTHDNYSLDQRMDEEFIKLSEKHPYFEAKEENTGRVYEISRYKIKNIYGPDIYIIDSLTDKYWQNSRINIGGISEVYRYGNDREIWFSWKDFLRIASDSGWRRRSEVYTLEEAIKLGKLFPSKEMSAVKVSGNGRFINGHKDPLCTPIIRNSFHLNSSLRTFKGFNIKMIEALYLNDSLNKHLHKSESSIAGLIYEYVLNGSLPAYSSDTLKTLMTLDEITYNASIIPDVAEFDPGKDYYKGDTTMIWGWQNCKYYILERNVISDSSRSRGYESLMGIAKIYNPPLYPSKQLFLIELIQQVTFDSEGNKKQYELQGITIKIPATINNKGIEIPICSVKWADLKKKLIDDKRANISYHNKMVNLAQLIEDRQFIPCFYKTGFLFAMDK